MLKDFSLGTIIYVLVSLLFGHDFNAGYYAFSILFSIAPDIDFIPYVIFKKRLNLVTHHIIHYPLIFVAVGLFIMAISNVYLGSLFVMLIIGHFVLDSFSTTEYPIGVRWLYPFSKKSWYIFKGKIYQLASKEQNEQLKKRRITWEAKREKRTILWEIMARIDSIDMTSMILFGLAVMAIMIFLSRS